MSWHGAAVFYAQSEEEKGIEAAANEKLQKMRAGRKGLRACKKEVFVDGSKRKPGELKLFFIDTVLENGSVKDSLDTVCIVDTICVRLKKGITNLEEMVIVSDNAPNHVNFTTPLVCFYVMKSHNLRLL